MKIFSAVVIKFTYSINELRESIPQDGQNTPVADVLFCTVSGRLAEGDEKHLKRDNRSCVETGSEGGPIYPTQFRLGCAVTRSTMLREKEENDDYGRRNLSWSYEGKAVRFSRQHNLHDV